MFCALQDHWSSGYYMLGGYLGSLLYGDVSVMVTYDESLYLKKIRVFLLAF